MLILISAVVTASLVGSLHCVGMCGPLAIWASGAGESQPPRRIAIAAFLYHIGRLCSYALAGLFAGAAGQLVDVGGHALGLQLAAARIVGVLMILIGAGRLWQILSKKQTSPVVAPAQPSLISGLLIKLRPVVFRLPVPARGAATGFLTAFLPCGWLYLFALVAAGTGSMTMGMVVMIAFWVGTVPALVGLVTSTQALATRFRRMIPAAVAIMLIVGGCYTASGRGFAALNSLADIGTVESIIGPSRSDANVQDLAASMEAVSNTQLPCCSDSSLDTSQGDTP